MQSVDSEAAGTPRKVVVAAHSGGAALTANILNRHPSLIDHALLVSSIYDVERWRAHMFERTGEAIFHGNIESLSPVEQIARKCRIKSK